MKNNLIFFFFLLISCKNFNKDKKVYINVEVTKKYGRQPFSTTFTSLEHIDKHNIILKGLPEKVDSFSIQYLYLFDSKEYNVFKERLHESNDKLYAYTAFSKNQQTLIVDSNFNLDFSDDLKLTFTRKLKQKLKLNPYTRDSIPIIKTNWFYLTKGKIKKGDKLFTVFPFDNYITYSNKTKENEFKNKHQLIAEEKDFFYGEFRIDSKLYKVAFKNGLFGTSILFQEKRKSFLNRNDSDYKKYTLKDTVQIHEKFYLIDTINRENTILTLKELKIKEKSSGHLKGEFIRNFYFNDIITTKENNIEKLAKEKKFLLIDFWGTWCAPCVELTPDLIKIDSLYKTKLNILSIAFQKDKNALKKYLTTHDIKWNNALLLGDPKGQKNKPSLINTLRIDAYPTFILINKDMKIVYRGIGKKSLEEIQKIMNSKN